MSAIKKEKTTITQVAKYAGVSIGTVSNYLNGTAQVSPQKAENIQAAIDKLHYTPDTVASSLRRKNSKTIYILTQNLNNTFYTRIISSYMAYAYQAGYTVQISGYEYSAEVEKKQLAALENCKRGTIVIIFNGSKDEAEIRRLMQNDIHVILADRNAEGLNVSSVSFDNQDMLYTIVEMLKKKNYKRIGLFIEPVTLSNLQKRYEHFLKASEKFGYKNPLDNVFTDKSLALNKLHSSYIFMKTILENHKKKDLPDAWIASSDYLAIGMMRAMNELGYRVPHDFGIIGFDNLDISGYVNPRLTTVEQNQELFGEMLWKVTKKLVKTQENQHLVIPQKLVERESC